MFRTRFELGNAFPTLPDVDESPTAFVVAVATVDQAWKEQFVQGFPDVGPQVRATRGFTLGYNAVRDARCHTAWTDVH